MSKALKFVKMESFSSNNGEANSSAPPERVPVCSALAIDLWLPYLEDTWMEAMDLWTAVWRFEETLTASFWIALYEENYGNERFHPDQYWKQLADKYENAIKICNSYVSEYITIDDLCQQFIDNKMRSELYELQMFLPYKTIIKYGLLNCQCVMPTSLKNAGNGEDEEQDLTSALEKLHDSFYKKLIAEHQLSLRSSENISINDYFEALCVMCLEDSYPIAVLCDNLNKHNMRNELYAIRSVLPYKMVIEYKLQVCSCSHEDSRPLIN